VRSAGVLAGVVIALGVVLPASAHGASIDVRETFGQEAVTYIADGGEKNDVAMSLVRDGDEWRVKVEDLGPQDLGVGCEATATGAICTTGERPRVDVDLGDRADTFDGSELIEPDANRYADPVVVDGGDGDDATLTISAYSCVDGQVGDDRIELVDYAGSIAGHGSCINVGGQGDDAMIGSDRPDFFWAGVGRDRLKGKAGGDELDAGHGLDELRGHRGADELLPGHGADRALGDLGDDLFVVEYPPPASADGNDEMNGRGGNDSALYLCGGCRIHLDGMINDGLPGEADDLRDVERVTIQSKVIGDEIPTNYGPGHDVLEGGNGDEVLLTKRGEDKLIGGGGEDVLDAGLDDDDVRSADGHADEVDCGPGKDEASVDQFDDVKGCEIVNETIFDRRRRR
jgi:Ca2+-binding RTX toxin-like protein